MLQQIPGCGEAEDRSRRVGGACLQLIGLVGVRIVAVKNLPVVHLQPPSRSRQHPLNRKRKWRKCAMETGTQPSARMLPCMRTSSCG